MKRLIILILFFASIVNADDRLILAKSNPYVLGSVPVAGCSADSITKKDFEDNNLTSDSWSEGDGDNNLDVQAAPGTGHGSYSMHHQRDTSTEARIRKNIGADLSDAWGQFYIRFDEATGWGNQKIYRCLSVYNGAFAEAFYIQLSSSVGGVPSSLSMVSSSTTGGSITVTVDTWYLIKWHYKASTGSDGVIEIFFDGVQVGTTVSNQTRTVVVRNLDWGGKSHDLDTTTLDVYFDDFRVRTDDCF